jgi:hypothetical protein
MQHCLVIITCPNLEYVFFIVIINKNHINKETNVKYFTICLITVK